MLQRDRILILLMAILAINCGSPKGDNYTQKAVVSKDQFTEAYDIIAGMDYIPFDFSSDGCYARSLYMSMELAFQEIPSTAIFIEGDLRPDSLNGQSWIYHVAPLVQHETSKKLWVIDPSHKTGGDKISLDEWLSLNNPVSEAKIFTFTATKPYEDFVNQKLKEADKIAVHPNERLSEETIQKLTEDTPQSFDSMHKFAMVDIADSCFAMYSILGEARGGYPKLRKKLRIRLTDRTRELVLKLNDLGKLESAEHYLTAMKERAVENLPEAWALDEALDMLVGMCDMSYYIKHEDLP